MAKRSRESSTISSVEDNDGDAPGSSIEDLDSPRPLKLSAIDMTETPASTSIHCSLPPHRLLLSFPNAQEFEVHYAKEHSNRCSACGKNFPTAHFLSLHTDENHNPFREALQAKGEKTYACFVQDCDKKCSTPQKRRLHLIDKHLFPERYNFRMVDTGIDKSTSMLQEGRRRRVSTITDQPQPKTHQRRESWTGANSKHQSLPPLLAEGIFSDASTPVKERTEQDSLNPAENAPAASMHELEQSMSALRFVPPSVASRQRNKSKPC